MTTSKVAKEWIRYTGENLLIVGVVTLVLLGIQILSAETVVMEEILNAVPFLLCVTTLIALSIMEFSRQAAMIPMILTMGNTRRSVFLWTYASRGLVLLTVLAISAAAFAVTGEGTFQTILTICSLLLIGVSILGLFCSFYSTRFQWIATLGIMVVAGGMGGLVGGSLTSSSGAGGVARVVILAIEELNGSLWIVASVLVLIDVTVNWLAIRRREVKI